MQWYYSKSGTQLGPVEEGELRAKIASGEVAAAELVWRDGMPDWQPVARVAEFASQAIPAGGPAPRPSSGAASPYSPPAHAGPSAYQVGSMGPPTSGLAIASLVCGIVGLVTCMLLPGIPAVICGHMALSNIGAPGARLGGRGMAVAGLVLGYIAVVLGAGIVFLFLVGTSVRSMH